MKLLYLPYRCRSWALSKFTQTYLLQASNDFYYTVLQNRKGYISFYRSDEHLYRVLPLLVEEGCTLCASVCVCLWVCLYFVCVSVCACVFPCVSVRLCVCVCVSCVYLCMSLASEKRRNRMRGQDQSGPR